jgi:hypothetical protein
MAVYEMKLFSQNFCSHAGALLMVLLLFLFAPAFDIQAQDVRGPSAGDDRQFVVKQTSPQIAAQIAETTDQSTPSNHSAEVDIRFTGNKEMRRLLLSEPSTTSGQLTPSQGSTKSTYVFPTRNERFKRYVWDTLGPWSLVTIAAAAGIDQWEKNPPEWGQGASGYGKRYASNLGQNAVQQTTSYGLSEAFRLDTGFSKSNRNGFGPRLGDALIQNVTSRTRTGKHIISVPRFAGFYVGGIVPAIAWYPSRFSYKDGLREGTYSLVVGFAASVIREFIFHR